MSTSATVALAKEVSDALSRDDRLRFREAVRALIAADAPLGASWRGLTEPLLGYGELALARTAIDHYVAWTNGAPAAVLEQATVYARSARPHEAAAIVARLPADAPDRVSNAYLRGTLALDLGRLDEARACLIDALRARPLSGQVAQSLATTGSMAGDEEAAALIVASRDRVDAMPSNERGLYFYALGKVHADQGDVDAAYAAYAEGAATIATARPYDAAQDRAHADAATAGWDRAAIDHVAAKVTIATDRPIIVTGPPRSGTTLVEQILVSHSAVVGGDEVGRFGRVVEEMGGPGALAARRLADRASPDRAARSYLDLLAERFPEPGRVVDKTLEASRYLGTLAAVMPEAPLIWVRRDPLARAWSCFSTYFMAGLAWSYDQQAMAAHFRIEDELLAHWQDMLGDRLRIVDYEALVADKAAVIPPLLAHAGLSPEAATLTPERTERLVRTASVAQVRQPITTARVDAARAYARHLQPFIDAYGYEM